MTPERPLPTGWLRVTLDEVCVLNRAGYWGVMEGSPGTSAYPVVRNGDIAPSGAIREELPLRGLSPLDAAKASLQPGDILVTTSGDVGKTALWRSEAAGAASNFVRIVRLSQEMSAPFCYYFLRSKEVQLRLQSMARGVTLSNLPSHVIPSLPFPLPPLAEQRRIAEAIETQFARLDAAVAALQSARTNLRRCRVSILNAACSGKLVPTEADLARAKGRDYEPASALLERVARERAASSESAKPRRKRKEPPPPDVANLPELPEGWAWATLVQVAEVASGSTPKGIVHIIGAASNGTPWYRVGDMNLPENQLWMTSNSNRVSESDARKMNLRIAPCGTIIFPKRGGAISTNKKRRLSVPASYDLNIMGLIPCEGIGEYIWHWFQTVELRQLWDGSNVPQINHDDIEPIPLPIPPLPEQQRIVETIEQQLSALSAVESAVGANLKRAERLRQAILKRAFEGRLVPQDPADEPAALLLERVKTEKAAAPPAARRGRKGAGRRGE